MLKAELATSNPILLVVEMVWKGTKDITVGWSMCHCCKQQVPFFPLYQCAAEKDASIFLVCIIVGRY